MGKNLIAPHQITNDWFLPGRFDSQGLTHVGRIVDTTPKNRAATTFRGKWGSLRVDQRYVEEVAFFDCSRMWSGGTNGRKYLHPLTPIKSL